MPSPASSKPIPLRSLLVPLDGATVALRHRAYAAAASALDGDRVLIWQDSGFFSPAGALHARMGDWRLNLVVDNLSLLEPRLQGYEPFLFTETGTALVEHAMAPLLELIERCAGRPIFCDAFRHLEPVEQMGEETPVRVGFVLLDINRQIDVRGWVSAMPSLWRHLDFSRSPVLPSTRYSALPIELSVQLGHCRLSLQELEKLEVGDALRITPRLPRHRDGLPIRLAHGQGRGGLSCSARLKGHQLILETPMKPIPATSPETPSAENLARPLDDSLLAAIECELSFELGHLHMSLAEIARLRVGQMLPTGARLQDQPVRILTGGRLIARGELAALGDEVVVMLTETGGLPHV